LLAHVVQALEEPIADPVTLPTAAVLGALGQAHRVVLTGDGSDELFGGYARYRALLQGDHAGYLGALCAFHPTELPNGAEAPWLPPRAGLAAVMAWEQAGRLPAYHLVRVDKLSMAASVEARVPFLRNAIVEAAAQLTDSQLLTAQSEKLALRKAAEGLIPAEILARPKQPFTFPVCRWLQGPLRSWATDLLLDPRSCIDQLVPRPFVQKLADQLGAGDPAAPPRIWSLLQLDGLGRHYLPRYGRGG
ncbi:MAG TPA: asparagine synthase C-terminal domain-containing protein, partial [Symbiobacteriaceae bacterium]|nr:asparagine synthase C-terminal domain-containing protein [Symbiobacteriaceae bacterium]